MAARWTSPMSMFKNNDLLTSIIAFNPGISIQFFFFVENLKLSNRRVKKFFRIRKQLKNAYKRGRGDVWNNPKAIWDKQTSWETLHKLWTRLNSSDIFLYGVQWAYGVEEWNKIARFARVHATYVAFTTSSFHTLSTLRKRDRKKKWNEINGQRTTFFLRARATGRS